VIKTCENAPKSLKSNEECEKYLPNNNCITQSGGGCRTNEECLQINAEKACVKDKFGAECFWEEDTSDCITKSCSKAPEKYVA
jgi:Notch-like protein